MWWISQSVQVIQSRDLWQGLHNDFPVTWEKSHTENYKQPDRVTRDRHNCTINLIRHCSQVTSKWAGFHYTSDCTWNQIYTQSKASQDTFSVLFCVPSRIFSHTLTIKHYDFGLCYLGSALFPTELSTPDQHFFTLKYKLDITPNFQDVVLLSYNSQC